MPKVLCTKTIVNFWKISCALVVVVFICRKDSQWRTAEAWLHLNSHTHGTYLVLPLSTNQIWLSCCRKPPVFLDCDWSALFLILVLTNHNPGKLVVSHSSWVRSGLYYAALQDMAAVWGEGCYTTISWSDAQVTSYIATILKVWTHLSCDLWQCDMDWDYSLQMTVVQHQALLA